MKNNNVYEINTRVWLKRFSNGSEKATLKDVPISYWKNLCELGINYIWLMGVWKTNKSIIKEYCFEPNLVNEYENALNDFSEIDVIGSPYSIDTYEINSIIGTNDELLELKNIINSFGIKLILDFVPNHFSTHSSLIETHPELFLPANEDCITKDSNTYFKSKFNGNKIFAHGKDPFFPAWQDTIQVNYFNPLARKYMTNILKRLSNLCDGVRCDMAMLSLNSVFSSVWNDALISGKFNKPINEFWKECISKIKSLREDFVFIGEVYWDYEWELQKLGFDFTYDKKLLDRLRVGEIKEIKNHLMADKEYQQKSVHFIENHDEERAISSFGLERSMAAAVIMNTINGIKLFYDGQFEGKEIKLPVQLGRESKEKLNVNLNNFYKTLLIITNNEIFKYGNRELLNIKSSSEGNETYNNFIIWELNYKEKKRIVAVNYSEEASQCRIKLNLKNYSDKFKLKDLLNDKIYYRKTKEINNEGLYIELAPFKSHIFSY